jgi:hypothetical protein
MNTFYKALTPAERGLVRSLRTPFQIQTFLDGVPYSGEERYRSPLTFLRERRGHCFDGAAFAAAMLNRLGNPPLIIDLLPNDRDDDHMLAPFRREGHWGAVAKSNFSGLRYREPLYRSVRELVMSYFDDYFNDAGEKTLRAYTRPLNLAVFDRLNWLSDDAAMDAIADRLGEIRQFKLLSPAMIRNLSPVDPRSLRAGLLDSTQDGLYHPSR